MSMCSEFNSYCGSEAFASLKTKHANPEKSYRDSSVTVLFAVLQDLLLADRCVRPEPGYG
jgi:hypothetical protein